MKKSKICFKCKIRKTLDNFYSHKQMSDGTLNKCKDCTKKDVKERYYKHIDKIRVYEKNRFKTKNRKAKIKEYQIKRRIINRVKYRAVTLVHQALQKGTLKKKPCVHCGTNRKIEAHHRDYTKPLEVVWCCFKCHREIEHGQMVYSTT